jgi:hypothetical protein
VLERPLGADALDGAATASAGPGYAPVVETGDVAMAEPAFGSGASEPARDAAIPEYVPVYAPTVEAPAAELPAAAVADPSPDEAPADMEDVADAYASPVFAPVAEASDVDAARAAPDDAAAG